MGHPHGFVLRSREDRRNYFSWSRSRVPNRIISFFRVGLPILSGTFFRVLVKKIHFHLFLLPNNGHYFFSLWTAFSSLLAKFSPVQPSLPFLQTEETPEPRPPCDGGIPSSPSNKPTSFPDPVLRWRSTLPLDPVHVAPLSDQISLFTPLPAVSPKKNNRSIFFFDVTGYEPSTNTTAVRQDHSYVRSWKSSELKDLLFTTTWGCHPSTRFTFFPAIAETTRFNISMDKGVVELFVKMAIESTLWQITVCA